MPEPASGRRATRGRIDATGAEPVQKEAAKLVVADGTGHADLGPGFRRRHRLVAALAAELWAPGIAGHRLALARPVRAHRP